MCEEASRLLGFYTSALSRFHHAQNPLLSGLKSSDPAFILAIQAKEAAHTGLLEARRRYWDHVRIHGCRDKGLAPAAEPQESRGRIIDSLWHRLEEAKHQLDLAHHAADEARQDRLSGSLSQADGAYGLRNAFVAQDSAFQVYLAALNEWKTALMNRTGSERTASREASWNGTNHKAAELLTRREREVLAHIASGKSSREIAALLGIAFKTVVVHRHHIQTKLDVHNTADLTRTALRMGLIEP